MEIFLDTASIEQVIDYKDFIDGVTTNPSLIAKISSDLDPIKHAQDICSIVGGHVSLEVISNTYDDMLAEGLKIGSIASNICVKLPCTRDGLRVCKKLSDKGIPTNATLCFSSAQAIFAAKCGATYVSPFIGRLDDIGVEGISLVEEIINIYSSCNFDTKVLAASIRNINHIMSVASIGVDAVTVSASLLEQCLNHALTKIGLELFEKDWKTRKK